MAAFGNFVWFDLMTTDIQGAVGFYTEVLGWKATEQAMGGQSYHMFSVGETSIGGLMTLPEEARQQGAPPHWVSYILVHDVDARHARAVELGARQILPPMDIPGVGRFSLMLDPQGAAMALFQGVDPASMQVQSTPGHVSWLELTAADHEAAWAFYQEIAGFRHALTHSMGDDGDYLIFKASEGDEQIGGMWTRPAGMQVPPNWLPYIAVADMEATLERVRAHGGKVLNGPMEVPGGDVVAQCTDPQGAAFGLHARG